MKLSIPEPCHENWNKMTPTERGRFCNSCKKEVVDFSRMNKSQIKEYFLKKAAEKTCGRFGTAQLKNLNKADDRNRKFNSKPWWVAAATFFIFVKSANSQVVIKADTIQHKPIIEISKEEAPKAMEVPRPQNVDRGENNLLSSDTTKKTITIKGRLMESDTIPLAFGTVIVEIDSVMYGDVSDMDGNFEFNVPKVSIDSITFRATYVGFEKKEVTIKTDMGKVDLGEIRLKEDNKIVGCVFGIVTTTTIEPVPKKVTNSNVFMRLFRR